MKRLTALLLLACLPTLAQAAANSQQNKMSTCNQAAADKKGDLRKAFMKACLGSSLEAGATAQQTRMKVCNIVAEGKKGEERKSLMRDCLKGAS